MQKLLQNILATDMSDVKKSVRDAVLFALGIFALKFLGSLDPHSILANTPDVIRAAAWSGADAVYSAWIALLMPMLMRAVRSGDEETLQGDVGTVGTGVIAS